MPARGWKPGPAASCAAAALRLRSRTGWRMPLCVLGSQGGREGLSRRHPRRSPPRPPCGKWSLHCTRSAGCRGRRGRGASAGQCARRPRRGSRRCAGTPPAPPAPRAEGD
eukprot:2149360-Prymnesium_polylepis.1